MIMLRTGKAAMTTRHTGRLNTWRLRSVCAAIACLFATGQVQANGTAPTVISGQASFVTSGAVLSVTNTPNAIINWQSFSIGSGEITNFIQKSANSAVLNRVVGADPSILLGALTSNGRVFLINPAGILIGQGARVDVAGLVASTLNLSNADFLAGILNFTANLNAGTIRNNGSLTTPDGGSVYLVAPQIENNGIITTPKGETLLAAGNTVQLMNTGTPGVSVQITGSSNTATNLGQILADSGQIGLVAAIVKNSGTINANSLVRQGGRVFLTATTGIEAGGMISAQGVGGGSVSVLADKQTGTLKITGTLDASAPNGGSGGQIETSAANVQIADTSYITTAAPNGKSGTWLIDPMNFTIATGTGTLTPSGMGTDTLSTDLGAGSIIIATDPSTSGNGDIFVNAAITWTAATTLTLTAANDVKVAVGSAITATNGSLVLNAGHDVWVQEATKTTTGNLTFHAGNDIHLDAATTIVTGNLTSVAGHDVNMTAASTITTGDMVLIADNNGSGPGAIAGTVNITCGSHCITLTGVANLLTVRYNPADYSAATIAADRANYLFNLTGGGGLDVKAWVFAQANNKPYDGLTTATVNSLFNDPSGILAAAGVTLSGTFIAPAPAFGTPNAGTNKPVTFGSSFGNADYALFALSGAGANIGTALANITPASLSVTANTDGKSYNGLAYSGGNGVVYSGFVNGEGVSVLGGALAYSGSAQGATNAGGYLITPGGLSSGNYNISYADGALTVNHALLSVTAIADGKYYNGVAYNGGHGVIYSGFVNGEGTGVLGGALTYAGTSQGATNAGSYVITPGGLSSTNYNFSYADAALTVNPVLLTVSANAAGKYYNGLAYSGGNGVIYSGFVNGEGSGVLGGALTYTGTSQGAINAGSYVITPGGLSSANYNLSYADAALTVNPVLLTVSANAAGKNYNGLAYSGGNGVIYSGFVNGEGTGVLGGALTYAGTSQGATNAGSYVITPGGLSSVNYNFNYLDAALTVNTALLTVTANAANKTYNGLAYGGGNGVIYSGFVNGEGLGVLGGTLVYTGTAQGAVNAANYVITPGGLSSGNYNFSYIDAALTVNPALLTVAANAASKIYNGLAYSGGNGVIYNGFVNGEGTAVLGGSLAYSGSAQGAINTGNYVISSSGLSSANYLISFIDSVLKVTPAPLSITANADTKLYNGLAYSGGNGVAYSGFVNGETSVVLTGVLTYAGTSQGAINAGAYALTPGGLSSTNYSITPVDGNLTVGKVPLYITANSAGKPYDGLAYSGGSGVIYSGFVNGESSTALAGTLTYSGTSQGAVNAGGYVITPGGLTATNYNIFDFDGALTVGKIPLSVTASFAGKPYDGLSYSGGNGVIYSGFVNGENSTALGGTLTYTGTSQGAINAGGYVITPGGLNSINYNISAFDGALTVAKAPLSVTANIAEKIYDGLAYSGSNGVIYSGFVNGEGIAALGGTLTYSGTSQGAINSGGYVITPGGLNSANYNISNFDSVLTINKAPLSVTANFSGKPYDGLAYTGGNGVIFSGFVNGETQTVLGGALVYTGTSQGAINAGGYVITPGGLSGSNYNLSYFDGVLTVDKIPLSVSANFVNKVYDGLTYSSSNSVSYSGFVNGENPAVLGGTLTYSGTSQSAINAGGYTIIPGGLTSTNYNISNIDGLLTVNPAPLTITANNISKVFGMATPFLDLSYSPFVNGETPASLTTPATTSTVPASSDVGSYIIKVSGAADPNYVINYVNGTLTVSPAPLPVISPRQIAATIDATLQIQQPVSLSGLTATNPPDSNFTDNRSEHFHDTTGATPVWSRNMILTPDGALVALPDWNTFVVPDDPSAQSPPENPPVLADEVFSEKSAPPQDSIPILAPAETPEDIYVPPYHPRKQDRN